MDETLLTAVYRHLKITWSSDDTDAEVEDICERAQYMLNDLLGAEIDYYNLTGRERDLYLNLCLYLYNGLTEDEFTGAYRGSLDIARQFHVDPINTEDDEDEDE